MTTNPVRLCANGDRCRRRTKEGESHRPAIVRKPNSTICSVCAAIERKGYSQLSQDPEAIPPKQETRGRKRLPSNIDNESRLRIQRSIASQKYATKNRLIKKFGSAECDEFKLRWNEVEAAYEIRKSKQWGKRIHVDIKKPRPAKRSSRILERGITKDGNFEWKLLESIQSKKYDIAVYRISKLDGARTYDAYLRAGLAKNEAATLIESIKKDGFSPEKFLVPLSSFLKKANEFINAVYTTRLSKRDIETIQKKMTLGYAIAIFLATENILLGGNDKRYEHFDRIYRTLGNIPLSEWQVSPIHIEDWIWSIISSPAEAGGRTTQRGAFIKSSYAKKLIGSLLSVFDKLSYFPKVFPWADFVKRIIQDKRLKLQKKARSKGMLPPSKGYRCLSLPEVKLILELCPTIHHVSLAVIGLSTGLRPQDLKVIEKSDWDETSGTLFFSDGILNSKNKSDSRQKLDNPPTSTVVKLILATPEFFDVTKRREIVAWFDGNNVYAMKRQESVRKMAKLQQVPVATLRDFRTTAATQLAFTGVALLDITRRLGHVSSVTTELYYVKAIPPDGGACAHISPPTDRGFSYLGNPLLNLPGRHLPYTDNNPWDTFLLVWFLEEVKRKKHADFKAEGHSASEIESTFWPEWEKKVLYPLVDKAIRHADIIRAQWEKEVKKRPTVFATLSLEGVENKISPDQNK